MKRIKLYEEFTNENVLRKQVNPTLGKSLEDLGKGFQTDEEIVDAICSLGFQRIQTGKERSADYAFSDPEEKYKRYISYTTGYVRIFSHGSGWFGKPAAPGEERIAKGPMSKDILRTSRERLLFILRRALKTVDLYHRWKKSKTDVKTFLETKGGYLNGRKFGKKFGF
jgi:hypothetical protein